LKKNKVNIFSHIQDVSEQGRRTMPRPTVENGLLASLTSRSMARAGVACPALGKVGSTMNKNNRMIQGIIAAGVLMVASTSLVAAQEVTSSRKVVKTVAAQYPSVLKRRGIGGTVKLRVLVSANGTVKDVQVLGGNPILSDCASKAVKQWVFAAAEKEESIEISVGFDPNSAD
jgi:TonB family protein